MGFLTSNDIRGKQVSRLLSGFRRQWGEFVITVRLDGSGPLSYHIPGSSMSVLFYGRFLNRKS
jgi:hypothetical protein